MCIVEIGDIKAMSYFFSGLFLSPCRNKLGTGMHCAGNSKSYQVGLLSKCAPYEGGGG